jgi:hypothetical protein
MFSKIYNALKVRLDDFPDEKKARKKLGLPSQKTPKKENSPKSQYSYNQDQHSPLDVVPVQDRASDHAPDRPKKKSKPKYKIEKKKKKVVLNDAQNSMKSGIDNIAESMTMANEMIDNADPKDQSTIELLVEVVLTLKDSESQIIDTISNTDHSELLDYAIKVNEDCQNTISRFKQLQRGKRPGLYVPVHNKEFKKGYIEEEVKLKISDDGYSDNGSEPAKAKKSKPKVDRTNEIKWAHEHPEPNKPEPNRLEFQQRMNPDPQTRPPKNYDSNVNRQVKLQKYELQSELEKRNADNQIDYMKNREIGYRDDNYYESKKLRAMKEAEHLKNIPVENYTPSPSKIKKPKKEPKEKPKEEPAKYDPYQVKSYGAPTTKLKEQIDSGNYLDPSLNESKNDKSLSGSKSSGKRKKKKKKKKEKKEKKRATDNQSMLSDRVSSPLMSPMSSVAQMPVNIQTNHNNQGFGGNNNGNSQQQYSHNSSRGREFGLPRQPPQDLMTPQKSSKRGDSNDPFAGIGFGGGSLESQFQTQANPTYGGGALFHQNNNPEPNQLQIQHQNQQQNNNFDDPFADAQFPNMNANNNSSIKPTSTSKSQSNSHSQGRSQSQPNMSMNGSNHNGPSTQYNYESNKQDQKEDDFGFDDINIDLDDLNLNDGPMASAPPETKMKQNINSGMPVGGNYSQNSMSSQGNNGMRQNMNPHMQNNMNMQRDQNMPQRDQNMPNMGGQTMPQRDQNMSSMGGQNMPQRDQNMPNMGGQNMPQRDQNMSNMGGQTMPQRAHKPSGVHSYKGPSQEMFNTMAPSSNGMGGNRMAQQNIANDDPFADMFPTANSASNLNPPQNMIGYNNSQMSEQPQNKMSYNDSQISAEPQLVHRGGPSPQTNPNNFNTTVPNLNNYGMNNASGLNSMGNFGTSSPQMQNNNYGQNQGPHSDNTHSNNMLVPVDPYAGSNNNGYNGGYNGGSLAGGFNTVSEKPKRKNPFAKKNVPDANAFQTSYEGNGGYNQPANNNYGDLLSQSSSSHNSNTGYNAPNPNMFATMDPNSGSMGLDMAGQYSNNQQNNNDMYDGQNNTNFNNQNYGGMSNPQQQHDPSGGGNNFDDIFS